MVRGVKRNNPRNQKAEDLRKFADGDTVLIIRPSPLWAGCSGTVVGFANGLHRIHIQAKDGEAYPKGFHADICGDELELYL